VCETLAKAAALSRTFPKLEASATLPNHTSPTIQNSDDLLDASGNLPETSRDL
jgi:hypothetical protein